MKTICITGHRPKGFPWDYGKYCSEHLIYLQEMRDKIIDLISQGFNHVISGGAIGVDLDFAEMIIDLRKIVPVALEIAIPCENQDLKWESADKKRYADIIKNADKITFVGKRYTMGCMRKRNEYMVDNADIVLAVYNGEQSGGTYNTIRYAQRIGKPVIYILLQDIIKELRETKERVWESICDKLGIKNKLL